MDTLLKLLEHLGCDIQSESWYDEEGVEGTRITIPNLCEVTVYGWGKDIEFEELMCEIGDYFVE